MLKGVEIKELRADPMTEVQNICNDSRRVGAGSLFVAERGYATDGHRFIPSAVAAGASVVVCEDAFDGSCVVVDNSRRACAQIAANYYGNPANRFQIIGVTGTNGKTTVTNLVKQLIERITGKKVGLIGTNRNMIGDLELETERTTPDSIELQELFGRMADAGCAYVTMEVSSHALYLDRVYGVPFSVGVFTNLTEDHLDFHGTMEAYAEAKSRLFSSCEKAVINIDDPWAKLMLGAARNVLTFSIDTDSGELKARNIHLLQDSVTFDAVMDERCYPCRLAIPGKFSVYNALTAMGVMLCLGASPEEVSEAMRYCEGVKGRAEVVPTGRDFTVLIDYAHSPDALENILDTVNGFAHGRVIIVFGCGGDREREKRPIMGRIAVEKSDVAIVTSDNPRTEEPMAIIEDIVSGIPKRARAAWEVIENRREAIARAISEARGGDVIILAGKGHETYQIIGREKRHFDEREIVRESLAKL